VGISLLEASLSIDEYHPTDYQMYPTATMPARTPNAAVFYQLHIIHCHEPSKTHSSAPPTGQTTPHTAAAVAAADL